MIHQIEELSLNAWPALQTMLCEGWLLRFANGYTKRANSINPLYYSGEFTEKTIEECERIYTAKKLPPVFKMTPFAAPDDLDFLLEQKGYTAVGHTSVQRLELSSIERPSVQSVQMTEHLDDEWLDHFSRLNGLEGSQKQSLKLMLSAIISKTAYLSLYQDDYVVACGLGVVEREYIGLFDIITDQHQRRKGFGEQILLHILNWGKENGAKYAYLQVVADNIPALKLYAKLGFKEAYPYWYRVRIPQKVT